MMSRRGNTSSCDPFPVALSYRLVDYMGTEMAYLLRGTQIFSGNMYLKAVTANHFLGSTKALPTA